MGIEAEIHPLAVEDVQVTLAREWLWLGLKEPKANHTLAARFENIPHKRFIILAIRHLLFDRSKETD